MAWTLYRISFLYSLALNIYFACSPSSFCYLSSFSLSPPPAPPFISLPISLLRLFMYTFQRSLYHKIDCVSLLLLLILFHLQPTSLLTYPISIYKFSTDRISLWLDGEFFSLSCSFLDNHHHHHLQAFFGCNFNKYQCHLKVKSTYCLFNLIMFLFPRLALLKHLLIASYLVAKRFYVGNSVVESFVLASC